MTGTLYGVGVGPGDPDLMTVKAIKVITQCDIIGIPAADKDTCTAYGIALQAVPGLADKRVVSVSVPMTTDLECIEEAYRGGCDALIQQLDAGRDVAFLNLGDPTVYGTYMNIHRYMIDLGYKAELVSGVPSFCAVAGTLGIPLGTRREAVHILPAYYAVGQQDDYQEHAHDHRRQPDIMQEDDNALLLDYLKQGDTVVLMKPAGRIEKVKRYVVDLAAQGICQAYAVTDCGMQGQSVYQDIRELTGNAGYFTTIVLKGINGG